MEHVFHFDRLDAERWISAFENNPTKACDVLTTFVTVFKENKHGNCRKLVEFLEPIVGDFLLLLEHCLIQLVEKDRILETPEGSVVFEWNDWITTKYYIRKLLEFLVVWFQHDKHAMRHIFCSGMLVNSVLRLCSMETVDCLRTAENMALLLNNYLDTREQSCCTWFTHDAPSGTMEAIAKCYSAVCVCSESFALWSMFLNTIVQCDYGVYENKMMRIFSKWVSKLWPALKEKTDTMVYEDNKLTLMAQIRSAKRHTIGFDYKLQAQALFIVVGELKRETEREKTELPAVREVVLRFLLLKDGVSFIRYHAIVDEILGVTGVFPPTEWEQTPPCELKLRKNPRRTGVWRYWELECGHVIHEYLQQNESGGNATMAILRRAVRLSRKQYYVCSSESDEDVDSVQSNYAVEENTTNFTEDEADSMIIEQEDALFETVEYYKAELERIFYGVLPLIRGDMFRFETFSLETSSSSGDDWM